MGVFDSVFGKKPFVQVVQPPRHLQPHAIRPASAFQKAWDQARGPSDLSKLLVADAEITTRLAAARASLDRRTEAQNRFIASEYQHSLFWVKPYFLVSDACWSGPHHRFLLHTLQLIPFDAWNVAFLAATPETSRALDIPVHPGHSIGAISQMCEADVLEQQEIFRAAHESVGKTCGFPAYGEAQDRARENVQFIGTKARRHIAALWEACKQDMAGSR